MPHFQDGNTPSQLQAKILQGLLASNSRIANEKPADRELPIKELLPMILEAFNLTEQKTLLTVTGQSKKSLTSWWAEHTQGSIAIKLAYSDKDDSPIYVMLPVDFVRSLLVVSLGGTPSSSQSSAPPSRLELRFANKFGPALADTLNPLLRSKIILTSTWQTSTKEALDMLIDQAMELIDLNLLWENQVYPLSFALAETKLERRATNQPKSQEQKNESAIFAAEIGKTSIRVEILFRLADQTINRLQNLKIGDVLPMVPNSLLNARMQVRGHDIYVGQIGQLAHNFGFKVSKTAQKSGIGLKHMVNSLTSDGEKI